MPDLKGCKDGLETDPLQSLRASEAFELTEMDLILVHLASSVLQTTCESAKPGPIS